MKTSKIFIGLALLSVTLFFSFSNEKERVNLTDDQFKVIAVRGQIVFEKSGKSMKRGDLYTKGTPLEFKSNESKASIYNSNSGRYVLEGNTRGKLKILPSTNNISTRSGALLNLVDLKNHFEGRYLVINELSLQINAESFPMNENQFFYLKYDHNGEEIAKKLSFKEDHLILDKNEIFKIDGNPIPVEEKEMTIYYKGSDKTVKINKFTPVFPENEELSAEVEILIDEMKDNSYDEKFDEITSYLNEFYGRPYKPNLQNWLKEEFKLEEKE